MKRLCLLLLMLMLPLNALALTGPAGEELPDTPLWQAKIRMDTRIRLVKNMDSRRWLGKVPEDALLDVYAVDGDWCICGYEGDIGYIPYDRLYQFYRLTEAHLPGYVAVDGIAAMTQNVPLKVKGYSGNTLTAGDLLCVQANGLVPIMHDAAPLPEGSYTFTPFVPVAEAMPGDALCGYTTFFNDSMGGRYPANRAFNIALAEERLRGVVILPGETFSFNRYCGPYTRENGYMKARNISKSGYGFGGGVCQVSTTIFNAVQGINVTLDEWYIHSYWGVAYVPRTLDAAVSSTRDFTFINSTGVPLELQVMAQNGVLTVIFRHGGNR